MTLSVQQYWLEINRKVSIKLVPSGALEEHHVQRFKFTKTQPIVGSRESTKDVEIVSFVERPGRNGDVQVYEFEYKVDSTRGGLKRIFSAAFVASKKLYLLNIAQSDNPQQPIDYHKRMMLEQVLHSFDVAPTSTRTTIGTQI